jgi:hypothetical protein
MQPSSACSVAGLQTPRDRRSSQNNLAESKFACVALPPRLSFVSLGKRGIRRCCGGSSASGRVRPSCSRSSGSLVGGVRAEQAVPRIHLPQHARATWRRVTEIVLRAAAPRCGVASSDTALSVGTSAKPVVKVASAATDDCKSAQGWPLAGRPIAGPCLSNNPPMPKAPIARAE